MTQLEKLQAVLDAIASYNATSEGDHLVLYVQMADGSTSPHPALTPHLRAPQ